MPALLNPLLDRPKMTRTMYEALKRHIMNERAKLKQEQEQDALIERMRKEREQRKKKEEEEALTLEQTKEQISQLEKRLEALRSDKHQVFMQLKKVLNQEEETRRRAQLKEQSEMQILQQQAAFSQHSLPPAGHPAGHPVMLQQSHLSSRPTLYKPVQMPPQATLKRARSPSPPPSSASYPSGYSHSEAKYSYPPGKGPAPHLYTQQHPSSDFKMGGYQQSQGGQAVYGSQSAHPYVQQAQSQQPAVTAFQAGQSASGKYSASQSAFSSYAGAHYGGHQGGKSEGFPSSYGLQRLQQQSTGYHGGQHGSSIPHQMDQSQKQGFPDEKYKQQGSIVTGIPGQTSANYQPSATTQSAYQNPTGSSSRSIYSGQTHRPTYY